jgi:predicted NACHT family NTPase
LSPEQKEVVQQRKRFCVTVASDLDQLNKSENWNDQQFTDLEAEVEADGWYYASRFDRIIRRRSHGQRRVPSLMKAIETSVERRLLLVGEPGSGKSVALRHLAHEFAERGKKSTDLDAKIPLYVNLKELPPPPDAGPSVGWIKSFVIENVRRGDADTAQYVRDHWDQHMNRGLWLFLFDSFDEIPAVMHAPDESGAIQSHAEAIRQFLDGGVTPRQAGILPSMAMVL